MKRNTIILLIIIGIVIVSGIIYLFASSIIQLSTNIDRLNSWCEIQNITSCYIKTPECFNDCQTLGLEYFKLNTNTGIFQGVECYCKLNGVSQRIW